MHFDCVSKIAKAAGRMAELGADLLYPKVCPVCMQIAAADDNNGICGNCKSKLKYISNPRCLKCGKQISSDEIQYCYDCARSGHIYRQGVGVWGYTKEISESIYAFKYHNQRCFAPVYADEIAACCGNIIKSWDAQALIPVPLHADRMKKRGYNQAALIAGELGEKLCIAVDEELLIRNRNTKPQKELDDKERFKNVENAFIIERNVVKYKKVILVDDIYTTGTTVDACAKALMQKGVREVYFVSLCIGRGF